jgi:hypothetical protein
MVSGLKTEMVAIITTISISKRKLFIRFKEIRGKV